MDSSVVDEVGEELREGTWLTSGVESEVEVDDVRRRNVKFMLGRR